MIEKIKRIKFIGEPFNFSLTVPTIAESQTNGFLLKLRKNVGKNFWKILK